MVFEFFLGGYFNSNNYTIRLQGEQLSVSDSLYTGPPELEKKVSVAGKENWQELLAFIKTCNWQKNYESGILDGTQWELKVKGNGYNVKCYGSNAYPENFNDFLDILNKLIRPTGVIIDKIEHF